jgi:hypothetical protein
MLVFPPFVWGVQMKLLPQKYLIRVRRHETFAKTFLSRNLLVKTNTTIINAGQHVMRKVCLTSSIMFTVIEISSKSLQLIPVPARLICNIDGGAMVCVG